MTLPKFVYTWTAEWAFCRLPAGVPMPEGWTPAETRPDRSWGVTGKDPLGDLTKLPPTLGAAGWFLAAYADRLWNPGLMFGSEQPTFPEYLRLITDWAPRIALWRRSLKPDGESWVSRRLRPCDGSFGDYVFEAGRRWESGRGWVWTEPIPEATGRLCDPEDRSTWVVNLSLAVRSCDGAERRFWVATALAETAASVLQEPERVLPWVATESQDDRFGLRLRYLRRPSLTMNIAWLLLEEILGRYPPPEGKVCARPGCGARVVGRGRRARYCSDRCAAADRQARRRARLGESWGKTTSTPSTRAAR